VQLRGLVSENAKPVKKTERKKPRRAVQKKRR
jgi:hypothetical protein